MRFRSLSRPLEGFEAPAEAWETEILPARLKGYEPSWLDALCLAGRSAWARLTPPVVASGRARAVAPVRLDADRSDGSPADPALDLASAAARRGCPRAPAPKPCSTASPLRAPCSSTS